MLTSPGNKKVVNSILILSRIFLVFSVPLSMPRYAVAAANNPPTVAITSPVLNQIINATVNQLTIQATTSDSDGMISQVEFLNGSTVIGTATAAPFQIRIRNFPAGNYILTAKATDDLNATSLSLPVPIDVSNNSSIPSYPFITKDYSETNTDPATGVATTLSFRIMILTDVPVIRGLFVKFGAAGEDSRGKYGEHGISEFMHLHGFAYVGANNDKSQFAGNKPFVDPAFFNSLSDFSSQTGHPELVNAPLVLYGHSAGSGKANHFAEFFPDRVIAITPMGGGYGFPNNPIVASPATCGVPSISILGELDAQKGKDSANAYFTTNRRNGALWSYMEIQGLAHHELGQNVLAFPFLDHAIRARYPAGESPLQGKVNLLTINQTTGWLADNSTWKSGLIQIFDYLNYPGDKGIASWFMDEGLALIYRAYGTDNNPLTITSLGTINPEDHVPDQPYIADTGANIAVAVNDSGFPNWTKLELYNQSQLLQTIQKGTAPQFLVQNLSSGLYTFIVVGTDSSGVVRTSWPVSAIIK